MKSDHNSKVLQIVPFEGFDVNEEACLSIFILSAEVRYLRENFGEGK